MDFRYLMIIQLKQMFVVFLLFQLDFFQGSKEKKHWGVLMHSLHRCTVKLPPLYLVWIACCELQVGKFPCGYYQRFRDHTRVILHLHISLVCSNQRKGKLLNPALHLIILLHTCNSSFFLERCWGKWRKENGLLSLSARRKMRIDVYILSCMSTFLLAKIHG